MKSSRLPITRLFFAVLYLGLLIACRNEVKDDARSRSISDVAPLPNEESDTTPYSLPHRVVVDEEQGTVSIEESHDFDGAKRTIPQMIELLEKNYPEIPLSFIKQSNDTLFVSIADATHLTQEMGSLGARIFLMEATYAFTDLHGIVVVHYDFSGGDHAIPGSYTRARFEEKNLAR